MIIPDSVILVLGWMAEQAQAGTLYQSLAILGVFVFIGIPVILCVVSWMIKSEPYGSNNQASQSYKVRKAHRTATLLAVDDFNKMIDALNVEDYDLDPLYCLKCSSEHLQTKTNRKKYCTKCKFYMNKVMHA